MSRFWRFYNTDFEAQRKMPLNQWLIAYENIRIITAEEQIKDAIASRGSDESIQHVKEIIQSIDLQSDIDAHELLLDNGKDLSGSEKAFYYIKQYVQLKDSGFWNG